MDSYNIDETDEITSSLKKVKMITDSSNKRKKHEIILPSSKKAKKDRSNKVRIVGKMFDSKKDIFSIKKTKTTVFMVKFANMEIVKIHVNCVATKKQKL